MLPEWMHETYVATSVAIPLIVAGSIGIGFTVVWAMDVLEAMLLPGDDE